MIIAGERRWRASKLAGLTEVPCIELDIDDKTVAEIALIENLQRKDLTVWEEADGLAALKDKFGYTQEEIAKKISKSRSTVTEMLTIAGLPEDIRTRCRESNIASKSTILEIARQFDDAEMHLYLDHLVNGTAKPKAKSTSSNDHTFKFTSQNPDFSITLTLGDRQTINLERVLQALKTTITAIESGSAGI